MFYFAYGSNMNLDQMALRCPGAQPIGHAILPDWALVERTHADIEPKKGSHVDGLLWHISPWNERSLDLYEGYHSGFYQKYYVKVRLEKKKPNSVWKMTTKKTTRALVYVMSPQTADDRQDVSFSESYRDSCREGAKTNDIPIHSLYQQKKKRKKTESIQPTQGREEDRINQSPEKP